MGVKKRLIATGGGAGKLELTAIQERVTAIVGETLCPHMRDTQTSLLASGSSDSCIVS